MKPRIGGLAVLATVVILVIGVALLTTHDSAMAAGRHFGSVQIGDMPEPGGKPRPGGPNDNGTGNFPGLPGLPGLPAPNRGLLTERGDAHLGLAIAAMSLHFLEVILVLLALMWGFRALLRHRAATATVPRSAALVELDSLYARGEVKRDDYLARRADLQ